MGQSQICYSRGDVAAALAFNRDYMIVQYGDLCWSPFADKAAIRKELERRGTISRNPAETESPSGIITR
jgi:hypothetical protein